MISRGVKTLILIAGCCAVAGLIYGLPHSKDCRACGARAMEVQGSRETFRLMQWLPHYQPFEMCGFNVVGHQKHYWTAVHAPFVILPALALLLTWASWSPLTHPRRKLGLIVTAAAILTGLMTAKAREFGDQIGFWMEILAGQQWDLLTLSAVGIEAAIILAGGFVAAVLWFEVARVGRGQQARYL